MEDVLSFQILDRVCEALMLSEDDGKGDSWRASKSVPASTRLEDPSRKGTMRTAKSAPFNPCPSREGPYSTVFSVSRMQCMHTIHSGTHPPQTIEAP